MSLGDYYSHYPILAAAVARTHGPVLEAGCGYGSTLMLHYMCQGQRALLSLDYDAAWLEKFSGYRSNTHILEHVKNWERHDLLGNTYLAVAFVDCAPGEDRIKLIMRLKSRCHFIVVHDTERDHGTGANYGYEQADAVFKHVSEFRRARPYTKVYSDFEEFKIEECDKTWEQGMP